MVGGVLADIYHAEQRNTPMALFAGGALFGTGIGPLVSGFIAQYASWRWIFYHQTIMDAVLVLAVVIWLPETRGSVLLSRRAGVINGWYEEREKKGLWTVEVPVEDDPEKKQHQRIRWKVKSDEERESLTRLIKISLVRPFRKSHNSFPNLWGTFQQSIS
jgi:MFS family permease